jgi:Protein of unknown function (DUF4054)
MTISVTSFVADYPEFANSQRYPFSAINYWGAVANLLLNNPNGMSLWDKTPGGFIPPPSAPGLSQAAGGALASVTAYAVVTFVTSVGETTQSAQSQIAIAADNLLTVASPTIPSGIDGTSTITGWNVYVGTAPGTYALQNTTPIAIGTNWTEPLTGLVTNAGSPPAYNTSGAKCLLDIGVELFIAHNLALEVQAQDAAAISAVPGTVGGPISSRSANGVSVSYDTSSGVEKDAGHWNLTTYGRRLVRLFDLVGMVPIQIGVGVDPTGGMNGPGWAGPPPFIIGSPGSAIY